MAEKRLVLLGEVCPVPLFRTQQELGQMHPDEILIVETDSNQAVRNIMNWCESLGHTFEIDEIDNGVWGLSIKKQ